MDFPQIYYVYIIIAVALAVALFLLIARRRTQSPRARVPRNPYVEALKLLIDGDEEGAYNNLQAAVKSGAAPTDAYIKLGNLLRDRGEVAKALQIHQSLTVKTDLSKAEKVELFMNLADDYAGVGNPSKSISVLETAIRNLHIKEPGVLMTLARHYAVTGARDKAYDTLREAKKHGSVGDRELALYLGSVGEAMIADGQLKEAKKTLQRALKHDPDCASCLFFLGEIAEKSNELDEAIDRWKQVAVLSPQLADIVLEKLETTLYEKGRFSEIEKVYNDVRAARVGDEAASLSLAAFYKKQGRGEDAIELLEDYHTNHPDSVRAALLLTSLYSKYRDGEAVERFLDKSLKKSWQAQTFECGTCRFESEVMRWHCPQCNAFDSFSPNHEDHAN